jgi:hypothetical protein
MPSVLVPGENFFLPLLFESQRVNGDAAESFRVQSVVKEELVHSMEEMLAIYLYLRQILIGRSAAAAVLIDVSYPYSDPSVIWQ